MGKLRMYLLAISVFIVSYLFSQTDAHYIKPIKNNIYIKPYIYKRNVALGIETVEDVINYESNNAPSVGFSLSLPYLPFNISVSHSFPKISKNKNVKTKSFDLQMHKYGRKYVLDAVLQKYTGFYIDNSNFILSESLRPKMYISKIGVNGQYVFNGERFSYPAAYNQSELQLKSAGSFLLGGNLHLIKTQKDEDFLDDLVKDSKKWHWGINGGYAYNWVLHKNWLINGSLSLGGNIVKKIIVPTAICRVSYFYNKKDWAAGFSAYADFIQMSKVNNITYALKTTNVSFYWLKRFYKR